MRIIAGKWRGTRLLSPPDLQTRPILDHVKEAVFNILGARLAAPGQIPPCRVLDLFAGTGSLGLEALSRGAAWCTFVEQHRPTVARLLENLSKARALEQAEVCISDATRMGFYETLSGFYELVFLDPPYALARSLDASTPVAGILSRLAEGAVIRASSTLVLRHAQETPCFDRTFCGFGLVDQRSYGGMTISFLELMPTERT